MLKKMLILFIVLLSVMLLVGCSEKEEEPAPDVDDDQQQQQEEPERVFCAQDVQKCPDGTFVSRNPKNDCEFDECPESQLSEEVLDMQAKIDELSSYEYLDDNSQNYILVKEDKIVVITSAAEYDSENDFRYNHIYLDTSTKEAYGYCVVDKGRSGYNCGSTKKDAYVVVDYDAYLPDDPFTDIMSFTDAEITNSVNCESRTCDVVDYTKDGKNYRMQARQRYVLPYKIVMLDDEGIEEPVVMYTNAGFNHLKEADVTPPEDHELLE